MIQEYYLITLVCAAHALASKVFPVPGGPYNKTPTKYSTIILIVADIRHFRCNHLLKHFTYLWVEQYQGFQISVYVSLVTQWLLLTKITSTCQKQITEI